MSVKEKQEFMDPNTKVWGYTEEDIKCFDILNKEIFNNDPTALIAGADVTADGIKIYLEEFPKLEENKIWTFIKDKILVIPINALTFLLKLVTRIINFIWNR